MSEKKSDEKSSQILTSASKPVALKPEKAEKPKACRVKSGKTVTCMAGTLKGGDLVPSRYQADLLKAGSAEWV